MDASMGMEIKLIKESLFDTGYVFEGNKLLIRIWGKGKKKGSSSCRFLRNKISHELMEKALHEVVERKEELFADMNLFINVLSNDRKLA